MTTKFPVPLLVFVTAFALAGCGSRHSATGGRIVYSTDHSHEPPTASGKYGGQMAYVSNSDPKTFNIWVSGETSTSDVLNPLYDSLNTRDSFSLKFVPRLADLPKISADGLTYTYTLKPGLKWSDGQPLTADDVLFTLDLILDPRTQGIMREGLMLDIAGPGGKMGRQPPKYRKIDDRTVEFKLPVPYAPAQDMLSFPIAPRHALEAAYKSGQFNSTWGVNTPASQIISCGPYVMSEYVPGQRVVYKPNPYFWRRTADNKPLPYLGTFTYLIVPDRSAMTLKFLSGESDVLDVPLPDYPRLKKGEAGGNYTVVDRGPGWGNSYLCFNQNPGSKFGRNHPVLLSLFQDVRFRQAVSYAINRQRICDEIYLGLAKPLYSPETPADTVFYDPNVRQYPYDLKKAGALLAQAGVKDRDSSGFLTYHGQEVKFSVLTYTESETVKADLTVICNDLQKIGLNATFTPITFNDLIRRIDGPPYDFDACFLGLTGGPEPHGGSDMWRSSGPLHQWWPKQTTPATPWEAQVDKLFIAGDHELDPAKRKKIYDQWQEIVGEQQPVIFVVSLNQYTAVRNHFGNIKPSTLSGTGGDVLWNLEEIYDTNATRTAP